MRIAFVGHHVAPIRPPFAGGVESLTWYLARWLARRGHEVVLFALPGSEVPGVELRPLEIDWRLSEAARNDVAMPPAAFMQAHHGYQRAMLALADESDRFDLVHNHSLHYLPVVMAEAVDLPMLLTLHTPPTPWLESAIASTSSPRLSVSAVSAATEAAWRGVTPVDAVIGNGVDLDDWPLGGGGEALLWCGRMVPEKAPHLGVDAARRAGLPLRLAGPIVDGAYWDAEVAPRLGDDVRYVGHLGTEALARLMGESSALVMTPAWEEPFGLVAAEAIATGTPVAAFARGGLPDLVGRPAGRLAAPDDLDDLVRAMTEAIALPRDRVRAFARAELGIDRMGARYEQLYAGLSETSSVRQTSPGLGESRLGSFLLQPRGAGA